MTVWRGLFVALLIPICWRSIPCLARIETVKVNEKSGSAVLVGELFGMAAGGFVNFDVEVEMDEEESEEALSRVYIVLLASSTTAPAFEAVLDEADDDRDPPRMCISPSSGRFEVTESASFNLTVDHHDIYSAYLVVCRPGDYRFVGEVNSTFVNLDPEGELTQHLAIEFAMMPPVFAVITVVYFGMLGAWIVEMVRLRPYVLHVHYLCLLCVLVKTIESALVAVYFDRQSKMGHGQETIRLAAVIFSNLARVVFLLTLLLFSLGWGFIRPSLRAKEGWVVAITMGLYAGISLVEAGCLGQTSNWCSGLALMEYAVRSLVMLTTVVAINYHITHIRGCIQLPWTSSSALEYLKLSRYLSFRLTFLAYLLLPTVLLVIQLTVLSWEYEWVYNTLEEFVTMLIYVHLGTTFAPFDPWLLTRAFDHSLEQEDS